MPNELCRQLLLELCSQLLLLQELAESQALAQQGFARLSDASKGSAYQAWLGFYNSFKKPLRWTPEQLVQQANAFSQTIGEPQADVAAVFHGVMQQLLWPEARQQSFSNMSSKRALDRQCVQKGMSLL